MTAYIIRRLLLIVPTLFGIMLINFLVIQAAPGGPIEQLISRYTGTGIDATARISGSNQTEAASNRQLSSDGILNSKYRGAQGIDPAFLQELEVMYGFDKPAHKRFLKMLGDYVRFDFGESFFRDQRVVDLVLEKMPVSISLGLWTTLFIYTISIPLGILKAVRDGSRFDFWSSSIVVVGNAIPSFLFAILLIVLFSGGRYFDWFPLRGLTSPGWQELSYFARIVDYFWHLALPILSMVIGGLQDGVKICSGNRTNPTMKIWSFHRLRELKSVIALSIVVRMDIGFWIIVVSGHLLPSIELKVRKQPSKSAPYSHQ